MFSKVNYPPMVFSSRRFGYVLTKGYLSGPKTHVST